MKKLYTTLIVALMAIGASAQMTVTVDAIIEDPCVGGNRGAIEITVTGGTPGYEFNWEGPFGLVRDTEDIYNLPGGDWDLSVRDTLGNTVIQSIFVPIASGMLTATILSEYDPLSYKYNISEYGKSDGWIQVEYVLNGIGNPNDYQFIWEHNGWETSTGYQDTISGLGAGEYTLVVTDTVGCTDTANFVLTQPEPETVIDTVEVIKFTEVATEATLTDPITAEEITVTNYGEFIRTSASFDVCKVYNLTGSLVKQVNVETDVSVNDLEPGVYLFYFKFQPAEIVQKFYIE